MNPIVIFIAATFLLYMGRGIFIPLLVAIFVWYLLNAIAAYYRKILPFREIEEWVAKAESRRPKAAGRKPKAKSATRFSTIAKQSACIMCNIGHHAFNILSFLLSLATFGGFVYAFITHIRPAAAGLIARLPEIQERFSGLQFYIAEQLGVSIDVSVLPDTGALISSLGASVTQFSAALGLVLVYILFMYIEQSTFPKKFAALFPEKQRFGKMRYILKSIDDNMKKYMFVKTFASALTAIMSYALMDYMGFEFAGVWAFIIFILNYVPTFGSIIAVSLPVLYSLLTAQAVDQTIILASGLIGLQILIGNIIEPRLTGKTLNLSTLAILINLVFWGMLWGPVGMFFSVPLLVATFIVTAQFDSTRWVAVLLSANGEIPEKEGD